MDATSIRRTFLEFFAERGHTVRPSAPVIPTDPTLLLVNAGMVPFKPYFLGEEESPYDRAVSVQKSIRTIDIDIIGTTARHMSFFEMLGNFSFGDYFKPEAMKWAHQLLTAGFGLDPERLWYTAYEHDDEAAELWHRHVGIPQERIQRGGKDNFWQMGVPGPCGPCAEIFYDRGPEYGPAGGPIGGGEDRYIEIWNLVFMQNIQDRPYHVVGELPRKSIDTGMGLERLAMILQDVPSGFDVDTMRPVREAAEAHTGVAYGSDEMTDVSLRILSDHGRTMSILIADGVVPSNDGRGYVLRRIIRRAVRHAWQLGGGGLVTPVLVDATVTALGDWYTELSERRDFISDVVTREEERFRRTLESGHQLLDTELAESGDELSGSVAFKLHDTFGFPIELTREIAAERGTTVDEEGFTQEMEAQRQRAKKNWKGGDAAALGEFYRSVMEDAGPTHFLGYEYDAAPGKILALVADGEQVDSVEAGREVEVFLDQTPFYAESGGQVGDTGTISTDTGRVAVSDTQHALQGFHGHRGTVQSGTLRVGQEADLAIDSPRRDRIRKSHTGTHVLHWALRDVLGDHASQAGSLVESGRLRFDFSHYAALSDEETREVESHANRRLIANPHVHTEVTTQDRAKEMGALAFFGDKYGDTVRVVKVGEFSVEFCGGTHTTTGGEVGPLVVLGESSIGSNIRRVEALTGDAAYEHLVEVRGYLDRAGSLLRASAAEIPDRVRGLMDRVGALEDELDAIRAQRRSELAAELAGQAESVGDARTAAPAGHGNSRSAAVRHRRVGIHLQRQRSARRGGQQGSRLPGGGSIRAPGPGRQSAGRRRIPRSGARPSRRPAGGSAGRRHRHRPGRGGSGPGVSAGRVLALDPGSTRIGVAVSDPLRIVATPLAVIPAADYRDHLQQLVDEYQPVVIVVGLPVGLSGREGPSAETARAFGTEVAEFTGLAVEYVDERFTSATAESAMLEGGVKRRDRRQNVDKVAAAVILRHFLDRSRPTDRDHP